MKLVELFWLFMTIFISVIFLANYESLNLREKLLYLIALLLSTFLYSFRRYSRIAQNHSVQENSNQNEVSTEDD
jgi:hypothetical protein